MRNIEAIQRDINEIHNKRQKFLEKELDKLWREKEETENYEFIKNFKKFIGKYFKRNNEYYKCISLNSESKTINAINVGTHFTGSYIWIKSLYYNEIIELKKISKKSFYRKYDSIIKKINDEIIKA